MTSDFELAEPFSAREGLNFRFPSVRIDLICRQLKVHVESELNRNLCWSLGPVRFPFSVLQRQALIEKQIELNSLISVNLCLPMFYKGQFLPIDLLEVSIPVKFSEFPRDQQLCKRSDRLRTGDECQREQNFLISNIQVQVFMKINW